MIVAIDAGNTRVKVGVFDNEKLVDKLQLEPGIDLAPVINKLNPSHVIFSSVSIDPPSFFKENNGKYYVLDYTTAVPITNNYLTPTSLGMDRLANAVGAKALFPRENCLIIDAGTCITYDFIDSDNKYEGGSISPGINIRFKALHEFTKKLPLVFAGEAELTGKNTEEAIRSGVLNGTVAEVKGIIAEYKATYTNLRVLICGGDTPFFESKIKESIFAVPDLVLFGLNRILQYNVSGN